MLPWILLVCAILFNSAGNVLLRKAGLGAGSVGLDVFLSWPFVLGGLFFGVNLLFYGQASTNLPVTVSYPLLVGASMILISLFAVVFFSETLRAPHLFGMALIVLGIIIISGASQNS